MELLFWLEQIAIWKHEREHTDPKQEQLESSEDDELPVASYPVVKQPLVTIGLVKVSSPNL